MSVELRKHGVKAKHMSYHDEGEEVPTHLLTAIEDLSDEISLVAEMLSMIATCPSYSCYLPQTFSDEPKH